MIKFVLFILFLSTHFCLAMDQQSQLLAQGASGESSFWAIESFFRAAARNDVEALKEFLANGGDVNVRRRGPGNGLTALHCASEHGQGHVQAITVLLDAGAEIDLRAENGLTALMCAANRRCPDAVRLLVQRGANLTMRAYDYDSYTPNSLIAGYSALHLAVCHDCKFMVNDLLSTVPYSQYESIRNGRILLLALNHIHLGVDNDGNPIFAPEGERGRQIPRDVRKLLSQYVLNSFTHERMQKNAELLALREASRGVHNPKGKTGRDLAIERAFTELAQALDLSDPNSYRAMRNLVKKKVHNIMFDVEEK